MKALAGGLIAVAVLGIFGLVGACSLEVEARIGTVEVRVTDAQTEEAADTATQLEISSIIANVSEVQVRRAPLAQQTENGQGDWTSLNLTAANPFDLVRLGGIERVLASAELEEDYYTQINMTIDRLDVTINDGSERVVKFDKPFAFAVPFTVLTGKTTTIVFDFDIDRSVVIEGDTAVINPIARMTMSIRYEGLETE